MNDLYRKSGVDTTKAASLSDWLGQDSSGQPSSIGGFAGLFKPDLSRYKDPHIVSCTDGIGTKLLLGLEQNKLEGLGQDLVAMCLNDLYVLGARPWFFLDYFATGTLDEKQFKTILTSIKNALKPSNTILLGGETAEMPGLYAKNHFDLAGFVVGCVDRENIRGSHLVQDDDILIGVESNGLHSNGYSLVRKWLQDDNQAKKPHPDALIAQLLEPTLIYDELPNIIDGEDGEHIHALANITGGGISENLPRILKENQCAKVDPTKLQTPKWMSSFILSHCEKIDEVFGVFNLGVGLIAAVSKTHHQKIIERFGQHQLNAFVIGSVQSRVQSKAKSTDLEENQPPLQVIYSDE